MATQTITVTNLLSTTIPDPINIALDDLTPGGYADQLQRIIRRVALHHRRSLKFEPCARRFRERDTQISRFRIQRRERQDSPFAYAGGSTLRAGGTAARRIPDANHKPMTAQPT
jgi:hypothetical protein